MNLAIVIPVYNESDAIYNNFTMIYNSLDKAGIPCHYMLVDDGSTDQTWLEISRLKEQYPHVSAIRFARNFGKEMAICAGLDHIEGDRYLIMDSDLQHPPTCVRDMMRLMDKTGANIVDGIKQKRGKESRLYRSIAKRFYGLLKTATGLNMDNSSDFKLIDERVVDAIRQFRESNLFFRGVVDWVGFQRTAYYFDVEDRQEGETSFSTFNLMKLACNAILSHTSKPLYLTIVGGGIFLIFALILGVQTLVNYFMGNAISGFSTVIVLLLMIGSMIMLSLGIIGIYISRIYDEVKQRPRYIISESANEKEMKAGRLYEPIYTTIKENNG
ncbi:glycosyltransferase family 2 protein [Vallitalea pronyensis]|uniref:Glycosyltransferase family 2 protein n=1 Tax=Vallitalea pronyensis TaxID=1348613 RepID=A0A8J8SFH5_9FIRM|nr:glycosyltransferase family 2 protein [Vallitalea pronyensis]QUI21344.1 glycosyltransferase family 2 protein [Vallitalea pronyensis]